MSMWPWFESCLKNTIIIFHFTWKQLFNLTDIIYCIIIYDYNIITLLCIIIYVNMNM